MCLCPFLNAPQDQRPQNLVWGFGRQGVRTCGIAHRMMELFRQSPGDIHPRSTLVVASVSVGNVGQLSCELLLANNDHQRVGYLLDPNVLPCFGHDPLSHGSSALSLELYLLKEASPPTYVLQQRAPAHVGRQRAFAANLVQWIMQCGFEKVVLSSSIELEARGEAQLRQQRCWYVQTKQTPIDAFEAIGVPSLLAHLDIPEKVCHLTTVKSFHNAASIYQEFLSRRLSPWSVLAECQKQDLLAVALLSFTVEGDNLQDGMEQTRLLQSFLGLKHVEHLQMPVTVRTVFGSRLSVV